MRAYVPCEHGAVAVAIKAAVTTRGGSPAKVVIKLAMHCNHAQNINSFIHDRDYYGFYYTLSLPLQDYPKIFLWRLHYPREFP